MRPYPLTVLPPSGIILTSCGRRGPPRTEDWRVDGAHFLFTENYTDSPSQITRFRFHARTSQNPPNPATVDQMAPSAARPRLLRPPHRSSTAPYTSDTRHNRSPRYGNRCSHTSDMASPHHPLRFDDATQHALNRLLYKPGFISTIQEHIALEKALHRL